MPASHAAVQNDLFAQVQTAPGTFEALRVATKLGRHCGITVASIMRAAGRDW